MGTITPQNIAATPVFSSTGCAIGINALRQPTRFVLDGTILRTAAGVRLIFPDEQSYQRMLALFEKDPDSVFVLESGAAGPIADYPVERLA